MVPCRGPSAAARANCIVRPMLISCHWRGGFINAEVNRLHAHAFETDPVSGPEQDWERLTGVHSLGWVTARSHDELIGFVNVVWDGSSHAWIQDLMVAAHARRQGVGKSVVEVATDEARHAGCDWLHVDFEAALRPFYFDSCGFVSTCAGLIALRKDGTGQSPDQGPADIRRAFKACSNSKE